MPVQTTNGKVSEIRLKGDRDDMVNLLQYSGTVTNIMQIFEPGIVDGDGKTLALFIKLGLMRGDSDPSINEPVVAIMPYAVVRCLNVNSAISTGVACRWLPRS